MPEDVVTNQNPILMDYSKPKVTIDLDEYNSLKQNEAVLEALTEQNGHHIFAMNILLKQSTLGDIHFDLHTELKRKDLALQREPFKDYFTVKKIS